MSEAEVVARLERLEGLVTQRFERMEAQLSHSQDVFGFFHDALAAHSERVRAEYSLARKPILRWLQLIQEDAELRFPHRKILDCLLRRYDDLNGRFAEMSFSELWKASRVGKGRLRGYLTMLLEKGYVAERDDGYRKFYRINESTPDSDHRVFK